MDKLTERVRKTIKEHHMVKPGDRVMAALSGGADSVCLLRILVQLRDILGIRLRAVHVHHGLLSDILSIFSKKCSNSTENKSITS